MWPEIGLASVTLSGTWERIAGNTFAFTMFGFVPVPDGTVLLAKNVGTEEITDGCDLLTVKSTMQLFYSDEGTWKPLTPPVLVQNDMIAHRIVVEDMVEE